MRWPAPPGGDQTLYLIGPGFGESSVLVLPGGEVVVVDCCAAPGGGCLTLELLKDLGIDRIDLLVISHPDLDHVGGLAELLANVEVGRTWLYPNVSLLRDLLRRWGGRAPSLQALQEAWSALDALRDRNAAVTVAYGHMDWNAKLCSATFSALAPMEADVLRAEKQLRSIVAWRNGKPELTEKTVRRLLGESVGDDPNLVSLALVGQTPGWKLLLGGDVEAPKSKNRGWNGMLRVLERDGRTQLVQQVDIVKVAHHGSAGAYAPGAWTLHSDNGHRKVSLALLTPFDRGANPPPHQETLTRLRYHAQQLCLTSNQPAARCDAAGWSREASIPGPDGIMVTMRPGMPLSVAALGTALLYR